MVFYLMFICGHNLFLRESFCLRFVFLILFHFKCILTTENLQLSCYKHNAVVSHIGAHQINSLHLLLYFFTFLYSFFTSFSSISESCFWAEMEENKKLQIRIQSLKHYTMVWQSYKAVYYFS